MTAFAIARTGLFLRLFLAACSLLALASCSGAVSGPPAAPPNAGALVVTPTTATMYSDVPFSLVVTGGTGTYLVVSNDQVALPVSDIVEGNVFTVVPAPVSADTTVTLTIRDTGTAAPVTVTATVKPRTTSSTVTVTPSASQSAACGASICAGGDAEVKIVLSQNGTPLVNRDVRFDVLSGDFRLISGTGGGGETLVFSTTTITDSTGTARVRVRALNDAEAQTGLLQMTDLVSGSSTTTAITIAPSSNAPLNAQPSTVTFRGRDDDTCANGITADVIVFGGRPPYSVSQPGTFTVGPAIVHDSGDRFQITATGQCTPGSAIAIVDNNGATVTVTAINLPGAEDQTPPPLVVSPSSVRLETCATIASVIIAGGVQPYFANATNQSIAVSIAPRATGGATASIRRANSSPPVGSPQMVTFSDGRTTQTVTVDLANDAQGQYQTGECPP